MNMNVKDVVYEIGVKFTLTTRGQQSQSSLIMITGLKLESHKKEWWVFSFHVYMYCMLRHYIYAVCEINGEISCILAFL